MSEIINILDEQRIEKFKKLGDVLQCNQTGQVLLLCSICSAAENFIFLDDLQQHHISMHSNCDLDSSEEQRNGRITNDPSSMSAESDEENYEYSNIAESDIKLEIEQTFDDEGDNAHVFAISKELSHLKNEEKKTAEKIQCSCCPGESYACIGLLKDHLFITQNLEAYPCDRCSGLFFNKTDLMSHQNMHDQMVEDESDYHKCQYCGTMFEHFSELETHLLSTFEENVYNSESATIEVGHANETLRSKHNAESGIDIDLTPNKKVRTKQYTCSLCDRIYRTKENLAQHQRSHTGEKPFECIVCFKKYNHSSYLNIHMRTHTKQKPYKCSCGKAFISRSKLTSHEKNHQNIRPHACNECFKTFRTPSDLRDHFRSEHTNERPYVCSVANCNKSFAKYKLLMQHKNLHLIDKKYKCFYCDMKFSQLAGRHGHEKRVHSTELSIVAS